MIDVKEIRRLAEHGQIQLTTYEVIELLDALEAADALVYTILNGPWMFDDETQDLVIKEALAYDAARGE